MSVLANPLLPAEPHLVVHATAGGSSDISLARKLSELFLRGDADLAEVTQAIGLWLDIDEELSRSDGLPTEPDDFAFDEYADEWPCTRVDPPAGGWGTPWIDCGAPRNVGATGSPIQVGDAWSRRFVRQLVRFYKSGPRKGEEKARDWAIVDAAVYPVVQRDNERDESWLEVAVTYTVAGDYLDIPNTLDWSETFHGELNDGLPEIEVGPLNADGQYSLDIPAAVELARQRAADQFSVTDLDDRGWNGEHEQVKGLGIEAQIGKDVSW